MEHELLLKKDLVNNGKHARATRVAIGLRLIFGDAELKTALTG